MKGYSGKCNNYITYDLIEWDQEAEWTVFWFLIRVFVCQNQTHSLHHFYKPWIVCTILQFLHDVEDCPTIAIFEVFLLVAA